jgi:hypothetical protein
MRKEDAPPRIWAGSAHLAIGFDPHWQGCAGLPRASASWANGVGMRLFSHRYQSIEQRPLVGEKKHLRPENELAKPRFPR